MAHTVTLNWDASTDAVDGYNVYRGSVSGQETTLLNTALVTSTSFVDSNPVIGETFYIAKSVKGGIESIASNEAKAVLLPAAPTQLVATIN